MTDFLKSLSPFVNKKNLIVFMSVSIAICAALNFYAGFPFASVVSILQIEICVLQVIYTFTLKPLLAEIEELQNTHLEMLRQASESCSRVMAHIVHEKNYQTPEDELAADLWKASRSQNPSVQDAIKNVRMIVKLSGE